MLILGLDPSQKTGWGLYDPAAAISAMRCGVLKIDAERKEFEGNAGLLGRVFSKFIREQGKPDFAVLERAPRQPAGQFGKKPKRGTVKFMGEAIAAQGEEVAAVGGGLQSTLSTNQMAAALSAILGAYGIPFETMTAEEWRKKAYGFGRRAGWNREVWKRHARQLCGQHKIIATNDDMAEACWIAFAGSHTQAVKMLQARAA